MPRYRGTKDGAAKVVGKLLLLIINGKETSVSLSEKLGVSPRQVNRYVLQLVEAGWQIERKGIPTHSDYWFELVAPKVEAERRRATKGKPPARRGAKRKVD